MLEVWGRANSITVQKELWALEELRVPFERTEPGMACGVINETFSKTMNSNPRVPTIDDGGCVLWESNAIVRYLAAKHGAGSLCPNDLRERADTDRWMDWASVHVGPAINPVFWGLIRTPADKRNMAQIAAGAEGAAQQVQVLEPRLGDSQQVAGNGFTMGDISVGVYFYRWYALEVKRPQLPRVEAYYERLTRRPAFQKHIMKPLT